MNQRETSAPILKPKFTTDIIRMVQLDYLVPSFYRLAFTMTTTPFTELYITLRSLPDVLDKNSKESWTIILLIGSFTVKMYK